MDKEQSAVEQIEDEIRMQKKVFLFEAVQQARTKDFAALEEDGGAANAFKAIFEDGDNALPTKEKLLFLLSILASQITFNEAQIAQIEAKMA